MRLKNHKLMLISAAAATLMFAAQPTALMAQTTQSGTTTEAPATKAEKNAEKRAERERKRAEKARKEAERAERKAKKQQKADEAATPTAEPAKKKTQQTTTTTTTSEPAAAPAKKRATDSVGQAATVAKKQVTEGSDGTKKVVKVRDDGAKVTIEYDAKGNVVSRKVDRTGAEAANKRVPDVKVVDEKIIKRDDGTTKVVRTLSDGSEVVIIKDSNDHLLERAIRGRAGRRDVVYRSAPRRKYRHRGVDVNIYLPFALTIPVEHYIVEYEHAEPEFIEEAFYAAPLRPRERAYTIDEVLHDASIRGTVRQIDLDTIHFDFGSPEIPERQIDRLQRIARIIAKITRKNPDEVFLIEGHTDAVGSDEANIVLSEYRAAAVKQALVDTFEIDPRNLVTEGYGEQYLKIPTEEAEPRNRRVTLRRITPLVASN